MKQVLLFFSGGNDSTLSACILASQGYDVNLITFDNGCEEGLENIRNRATVLEELFLESSKGRIRNLGIFQTVSEFVRLRQQSANMPFLEMVKKYGNLNQNQINCLNCRCGMYVIGTVVARELGINCIAEGARKNQMFALEQRKILERYATLLKGYDIELLLPVYDYDRDCDVENDLWNYSSHFYDVRDESTLHYEAQCWLGIPMDRSLTEAEIDAYGKFYDDKLLNKMIEDINNYPTYPIIEQLKNPIYSKVKFK